jgi:hypothetical protein
MDSVARGSLLWPDDRAGSDLDTDDRRLSTDRSRPNEHWPPAASEPLLAKVPRGFAASQRQQSVLTFFRGVAAYVIPQKPLSTR